MDNKKLLGLRRIRDLLVKAGGILKNIREPIFERAIGVRDSSAPFRHPFMVETIKFEGKDNVKLMEIGSFIGVSLFTWSFAANKYLGKAVIYTVDPLLPFLGKEYKSGRVSGVNKLEEAMKRERIVYCCIMRNV
jgi:hypothetical protein